MIEYNVTGFEQVNKTKARNLFNNDVVIYIIPSKCRFEFDGNFITPTQIYKGIADSKDTFDELIFQFEYWNCVDELGTNARYFVKSEVSKNVK